MKKVKKELQQDRLGRRVVLAGYLPNCVGILVSNLPRETSNARAMSGEGDGSEVGSSGAGSDHIDGWAGQDNPHRTCSRGLGGCFRVPCEGP